MSKTEASEESVWKERERHEEGTGSVQRPQANSKSVNAS